MALKEGGSWDGGKGVEEMKEGRPWDGRVQAGVEEMKGAMDGMSRAQQCLQKLGESKGGHENVKTSGTYLPF